MAVRRAGGTGRLPLGEEEHLRQRLALMNDRNLGPVVSGGVMLRVLHHELNPDVALTLGRAALLARAERHTTCQFVAHDGEADGAEAGGAAGRGLGSAPGERRARDELLQAGRRQELGADDQRNHGHDGGGGADHGEQSTAHLVSPPFPFDGGEELIPLCRRERDARRLADDAVLLGIGLGPGRAIGTDRQMGLSPPLLSDAPIVGPQRQEYLNVFAAGHLSSSAVSGGGP